MGNLTNVAPELYKTHKYTEEEEALYKEIAKRLTDQHKWPESELLVELYKMAATPDQVRVMIELPTPAEEIAQKLGMDKKFVEDTIEDQYRKGIIVPTRRGWQNMRQIYQYKNATMPVNMYDGEPWRKEYVDLFHKFYHEYYTPNSYEDMLKQKGVQRFRVLPHWKAFEDIEGVTEFDDAREILKKAELICVLPCACKRHEPDKACQSPEVNCINMNNTARYNIDKGPGKELTLEEALKVHEEAMDWGMVMTPLNQREVGTLICNCHPCTCCDFFATQLSHNVSVKERCAPSRFQTWVGSEKCQACQTCVRVCPFGAAKVKQYEGEKHPRHPLGNPLWKGWVDPKICMGCGLCVVKCPHKAREFKLVRPPEFIPEAAPTGLE